MEISDFDTNGDGTIDTRAFDTDNDAVADVWTVRPSRLNDVNPCKLNVTAYVPGRSAVTR